MKKTRMLAVAVGAATFATPTVLALPVAYAASGSPVLHQGAAGQPVRTLQTQLNALGFTVGPVDGQFGPQTFREVEAFQMSRHLPVTGTVDAATWLALNKAKPSSTQSSSSSGRGTSAPKISNVRQTKVYLNHRLISQPYAFTAHRTTYMPIWYLKHMLAVVGIKSSWNGSVWALSVPASFALNLSQIHLAARGQTIAINGTAVTRLTGISHPDVYTHKPTEYMPIYFLQHALQRVGIQYHWNGTQWTMALAPPQQYTAYSANGTVLGHYPTLDDAKAAISNQPGGQIRNASGSTVYTQPQTVTYTVYSPIGQTLGTYTALSGAQAAVAGLPGGTIVDSSNHFVFTESIPFAAYDQNGHLLGIYTQLGAAEAAMVNQPSATVKGVNGQVLFTQSTTLQFNSYTSAGTFIGAYNQLSQAEQAVFGDVGATVRDATGKILFTEPSTTSYGVYSPSNGIITTTTTFTDAETAAQLTPLATVQDSAGNVLYVQPAGLMYTAFTPNGGLLGLYGALSVAEEAVATVPGSLVKDPNGNIVFTSAGPPTGGKGTGSGTPTGWKPATDFSNVDLRYKAPNNVTPLLINQYLASHGSPLAGLGQTFVNAQMTYGVDANYLVSHAILESTWGKSQIAQAKNNIFGYGAYDSNPGIDAGRFPSLEYAISYQAWSVRHNYLTPGIGLYVSPTLIGMNVHYASDPHWATSISSLMGELASYAGDSVSSYPAFASTNTAPTPTSTDEPLFDMVGAKAVVQSTPNYGNLPYYSDWNVGESQMFVRNLQSGNIGRDVGTLQNALNQADGEKLTVDGVFGQNTKAAVIRYQRAHGLSQTGICNYAMWRMLEGVPSAQIPAHQTVSIDAIAQGLADGYVIEWYHVVGTGWVDSQFVHFTNVYGLTVNDPLSPSDTSIPVYAAANATNTVATIHAGDFVVSTSPTPVNGWISIQFVNPVNGQAVHGWIKSTQARLSAVQ